MERFITCSKVLYDKDISDKMDEITSLKKEIACYETPQIEYSTSQEWATKKEEAYKIIKNGINKWIVEDEVEYQHMLYEGLTTRQITRLPFYIIEALTLLIKGEHTEWVEKTSYDIIYGIEGFFNGFIKTGIWDFMYFELEAETISEMIYNNIVWQLDDGTHSPCILDDIVIQTSVQEK